MANVARAVRPKNYVAPGNALAQPGGAYTLPNGQAGVMPDLGSIQFEAYGGAAQPAATPGVVSGGAAIYQPGATGGTYESAVQPLNLLGGGETSGSASAAAKTQGAREAAKGESYSNLINYYYGQAGNAGWSAPTSGWASPANLAAAKGNMMAGGAGGGAGGSGQPSFMDNLFGAYQDAYNQGVKTNEQRYQDILGGYRDRYGQAQGELDKLGATERANVERGFTAQSTAAQQDLMSRGVGQTTVAPTLQAGIERQKQQSLQSVEEGLARERLGTLSQLSGDTLGFMERRQDNYPGINQLVNLAMQLGNQGSGGGMAAPAGMQAGFNSPAMMGYNIPGQSWGTSPAFSAYNASATGGGGSAAAPVSAQQINGRTIYTMRDGTKAMQVNGQMVPIRE